MKELHIRFGERISKVARAKQSGLLFIA